MAYTWDEIVSIMEERRRDEPALKRAMLDVRDRVNGDYVLPLYDVKGEPLVHPLAPQLIADAIESKSMRAASTNPQIACPALNESETQRLNAQRRRTALYAHWDDSNVLLSTRRGFRHLAGYGTVCWIVEPDMRDERARVSLRDPLTVFPEPRAPEDIRPVGNCGFIYARSAQALARMYPTDSQGRDLTRMWEGIKSVNEMVDVIEWIDGDYYVWGLLGLRRDHDRSASGMYPRPLLTPMELRRIPNRAGMVPVAVGHTVTLDRIASAVQRITGIADTLDMFTALETIAAEKAVFPDRYVIGGEGRTPVIVGGQWQDGRTGNTNVLMDARQVGELVSTVGPNTAQVISRLERSARLSGGNPGLFSGELTGSLRSGQTVSALGSFAVDPAVAEMQDIMAAHLSLVNRGIAGVSKGYFGAKSYRLWSGRGADPHMVEVRPNRDFADDTNKVSYAFPGSDVNAITVALGQAVGTQMMSKATARAKHPMVDNPDHEAEQIAREQLEDALYAGLRQQMVAGQIPVPDAARIIELMRTMPIEQAISQAQREAQERQATPTEDPAAQQPGLAMPGMGMEAPAAPDAFQGATQDLRDLRQLTVALNNRSTATPAVVR